MHIYEHHKYFVKLCNKEYDFKKIIYIVIHRQTVLLYHNTSVWLDRLDSWSWDQNTADSNANLRFYHSAMTRKPAQAKEI